MVIPTFKYMHIYSTSKMESKKKDKEFWNLKVPVFYNKRTGQMSVVIPKKKAKKKLKFVYLGWKK